MKKILLTDVDDTLLDWLSGFISYAGQVLNRNYSGRPTNYQLEDYLGITGKEVVNLITTFNEGVINFGMLKPISNSDKYLPEFHKAGWQIVAISTCASSNQAHLLRKRNLVNVFGDIFSDIHLLPLHEKSKTRYLEQYSPGVWVEDKLSLAIEGQKLQHETFIFRRLHNRADQNSPIVTWVDDWQEIAELVL